MEHGGRRARRHIDLHPPLSRIAGARDEAGAGVELQLVPCMKRQPLDSEPRPRGLEQLDRTGALERQDRQTVPLVDRVGSGLGYRLRDRGHVRGVRDHQPLSLREAIDEHVIDAAAVFGQDQRVRGAAAGDERGDICGESSLKSLLTGGSRHAELAEMRDVEHTGRGAHRVVLGDDAGVLEGHLPAAEVGQPCTQLPMLREQRGRPLL